MICNSRKEAERIASAYFGERWRSNAKMHVLDINETGLRSRDCLGLSAVEDCWVAYVPDGAASSTLSPSRIICILKVTGEVVYDGSEGGGFSGWVNVYNSYDDQKAVYQRICS